MSTVVLCVPASFVLDNTTSTAHVSKLITLMFSSDLLPLKTLYLTITAARNDMGLNEQATNILFNYRSKHTHTLLTQPNLSASVAFHTEIPREQMFHPSASKQSPPPDLSGVFFCCLCFPCVSSSFPPISISFTFASLFTDVRPLYSSLSAIVSELLTCGRLRIYVMRIKSKKDNVDCILFFI